MATGKEKFGAFIRREREGKGHQAAGDGAASWSEPDVSFEGGDRRLEAG